MLNELYKLNYLITLCKYNNHLFIMETHMDGIRIKMGPLTFYCSQIKEELLYDFAVKYDAYIENEKKSKLIKENE